MMRKLVVLAVVIVGACVLVLAFGWSRGQPPPASAEPQVARIPPWQARPLIGANYTHYVIDDCSLEGTGILAGYENVGVRDKVKEQLAAMRGAGLQALRVIVWHQSDARRQRWGVISSPGGRLSERYRRGFAAFFADVRRAGFTDLFVSFAPMGSSDPRSPGYRPFGFKENWRFLTAVRAMIKRYGPRSTRFDLMNEAPPSYWEPRPKALRASRYITRMYRQYGRTFGTRDVTVSSIAGVGTRDAVARIENVIAALRSTGLPNPRWFEVHVSQRGKKAFDDLLAIDRTLSAHGLRQPLVIGEVAYNDRVTARALARFVQASPRQIIAILEWPLTRGGRCRDMSVSPPYRADAYMAALWANPGAGR